MDHLTQADKAFHALLAAADRAELIPLQDRDTVLHELAFYGVSYHTIFQHLAEALQEEMDITPGPDLPQLETQRDDLIPHLQHLLGCLSEEASHLSIQEAGRVSGMIREGQWQHVFRVITQKLVWVVLNEDPDGSV